jgi:hypothetical protein
MMRKCGRTAAETEEDNNSEGEKKFSLLTEL